MKTKLFLSLALMITMILTASFLPDIIPTAQASAAVSVEDPTAVERVHITNQPLALGMVGLICVLFGALTVMPLLNLDPHGGSAVDDLGIYFDQH